MHALLIYQNAWAVPQQELAAGGAEGTKDETPQGDLEERSPSWTEIYNEVKEEREKGVTEKDSTE